MNGFRRQKIESLRHKLSAAGVRCGVAAHHERGVQAVKAPAGLPVDLLQRAVLNEVAGKSYGDTGVSGFVLMVLRALAANRQGAFLWCSSRSQILEGGRLFGPGLKAFGLDPASIIQLEVRRGADGLWAMEEAARSGALNGVVGIVDNLSFTQSRRLSLAAVRGATPVFMIRPRGFSGANTAFSRWQVRSRPSDVNVFEPRAPGTAVCEVQLCQCRDGRKGKWICHYECQTDDVRVAAASGNRAGEAAGAPAGPIFTQPQKRAG